jgi:hypothetical protein
MSDWLKVFAEMSLDNLFVISGLIFLGIAVVGKITGKIDPGSTGRVMSALLGACLLFAGLWIHSGHVEQTRSSKPNSQVDQSTDSRSKPPKTVNEAVGLGYFSGRWKNTDLQTRGITTVSVRTQGNSVWMHAWGRCRPSDCDWGEVPANAFGPDVSAAIASNAQSVAALFKTSFSETSMTLRRSGADLLEAETQTRFTDNSGRSSYSATYTFSR